MGCGLQFAGATVVVPQDLTSESSDVLVLELGEFGSLELADSLQLLWILGVGAGKVTVSNRPAAANRGARASFDTWDLRAKELQLLLSSGGPEWREGRQYALPQLLRRNSHVCFLSSHLIRPFDLSSSISAIPRATRYNSVL